MSPFLNANSLNLFNNVCNNNNSLLSLDVSPSRASSAISPLAIASTTNSLLTNNNSNVGASLTTTIAPMSTTALASTSTNVTTTTIKSTPSTATETASINSKQTMAQNLYLNTNFNELFGANFVSMFNANPSAAAAALSFMTQNQSSNSLSNVPTTNMSLTNTPTIKTESNLPASTSTTELNTSKTRITSSEASISPKSAITQNIYSNANFNELFGANITSMFNANPSAAAAALAYMTTSQSQTDLLLKNYSPTQTTAKSLTSTNTNSWPLDASIVGDFKNDETLKEASQTDEDTKSDIKLIHKHEITSSPAKNSVDSE